ncbi:MAG TPA: hypothetical protein VJK48_01740 [Chlamydiales bacterium]|nr:hypothetical protein [Chlamydiales bacterium]
MADIHPTQPNKPHGLPSDPSKPKEQVKPFPPTAGGGGAANMSEFMKLFSPEERKKFMDILVKSFSHELERASKKYIEELRRQRQEDM